MAQESLPFWETCEASVGEADVHVGGFVPFDDPHLADLQKAAFPANHSGTRPNHSINQSESHLFLSHVTGGGYGWNDLRGILEEDGFLGGNPRLPERFTDMDMKVSWWAVCPPPDSLTFLDEDKYGASPLLAPSESRYGNYRFKFSLDDLLHQYKSSLELGDDDIDFRVLGTSVYKQEVMYAVLVCSRELICEDFPSLMNTISGEDEIYPALKKVANDGFEYLSRTNEVVRCQRVDGKRVWTLNPQLFAHLDLQRQRPLHWDLVSFAFHLPQGKILSLPPLPDFNNQEDYSFSIVNKVKPYINYSHIRWDKAKAADHLFNIREYSQLSDNSNLQNMEKVAKKIQE